MKILRDALIIIVLGGIVLYFAVTFFERVHEASVHNSIVVREASVACLEDEMICSFSSEESARAYLNSPEHLAQVKERENKTAQETEFKKRVDALVKQGKSKIRAACRRDGSFNCDLITNDNLDTFAELLVRKRFH